MDRERQRKSLRLAGYDYTQAGGYFVAIGTYQRACLFGKIHQSEMIVNDIGQIVIDVWSETQIVRPNVLLDDFIVMPNHVHGILFIREIDDHHTDDVGATRRVAPTRGHSTIVSRSLGAIIGQIKSISTKRINCYRGTSGVPVWQRNYYEHIIRNEQDLLAIRQYIANNPLQWDLDNDNPVAHR